MNQESSTTTRPHRGKPGALTAIAACLATGLAAPAFGAAGDLIGSPASAGTTSTNYPFNNGPRVASDANGNLVTTWVADQNGAILAQRFDASGHALGSPIQVAAAKPSDKGWVTNPVVAVNASGQFVIAWTDEAPRIFWTAIPIPINGPLLSYSAWPTTLHARTFKADGTPVSGDVQFANMPLDSIGFTSASVAMDDDGDFVAGWWEGSRSVSVDFYVPALYTESQSVYARVYSNSGKARTAAIRIDSGRANKKVPTQPPVGHLAGPVAVGMDGAGNFTAAWNTIDTTATTVTSNIMAKSFTVAGKASGSAITVNQTPVGIFGGLAMNRSGQSAVTWVGCQSNLNSDSEQICARSFQPGNVAASGEITVPTDLGLQSTYSYTNPSIAIDAAGNFIVGANIEVGNAQIVRLFAANGAPLSPTVTLPQAQNQPDSGFGVSMDASGNAAAAYIGASGSDPSSNPVLLQRISGH